MNRTWAPAVLVGVVLLAGACGGQVAGTPVASSGTGTAAGGASSPSSTAPSSAAITSGPSTSAPAQTSSAQSSVAGPSTEDSSTADSSAVESGSGAPTTDGTTDAPSSGTSGASEAPTGSGTLVNPAEFAKMLSTANASATSLIGKLDISAGPTVAKATFSEALKAGKVTAMDMNLTVTAGGTEIPLRLLLVGGKVYVGGDKILQSLGVTGKKWALASKDSANSTLKGMATQLGGYLDSAGIDQYATLSAASSSIRDQGPSKVGGLPTHRYQVVVDVSKAAQNTTGAQQESMQQALAAGVVTLPYTIELNSENRVVQVQSRLETKGTKVITTFDAVSYNKDVTINPPDPASVSKG